METSSCYSSQALVRSFATRLKAGSSTAIPWAFPLKRRVASTSIRKPLKAQRPLHCGHSLRPRSRVLVKTPGLTMCQFHKRGLNLTLPTSKKPPRPLNREDIESWSEARKNPGDKPSVVSSHQKDCWSASLSRRRCETKSNADREQHQSIPRYCCRPLLAFRLQR